MSTTQYPLSLQQYANADEFWSTVLQHAEPAESLPPAIQSRSTDQSGYGTHELALSAKTTAELNTVVDENELSLHTLLQGAWVMMLSQFASSTDIVFGALHTGQHNADETNEMAGSFSNTIPVRSRINLDATFLDLLRDLHEYALAAAPYAQISAADIRAANTLPPDAPLFFTLMLFEEHQRDAEMQNEYPLTGSAYGGTELSLTIAYDLSMYTQELGERMLDQWRRLLETMLSGGLLKAAYSLPLLTSSEKELLQKWNDTAVSHPPIDAIQHLFEKQAEQQPEATAVVFNDQQLTYAELNQRANKLAHYLQANGVKTGKFVGIFLDRSLEMIIALMGVLKAGGAYLPLDPTYPPERLAFMLGDANPSILLTRKALLNDLPLDGQEEPPITLSLDSEWATIDQYSDQNLTEHRSPYDLAYIIYTSGSTGTPKGVMVPHKSLINYTLAGIDMFELTPRDHVLQFASFSFDTSAEEIMPCLASGAALILRPETMIDSIPSFLQSCTHYGLSVIDLPTAYWHELTAVMTENKITLPPSLRLIIIGGEAAMPERVAAWQAYAGKQVRLLNTYGATELTIISTMYDLTSEYQDALAQVPIGRPIQNVQTYIMDEYQRPTPIGLPGELYFGGAGLARGYLNRPELTKERFARADEFSDRLYRSGDVGRYLPDGNIEYIGRADFQVKIRGYRVEMGEVEAVLSLHPSVRMAAVTAHGETGNKMLVAYMVLHADAEQPDTMAMRDYLGGKMPPYMTPSAFVYLDEFPLTPSQKVDRKALPAPDFQAIVTDTAPVLPRTPTEKVIFATWQELLPQPISSIHDDFFVMGGHSLLAIRMFARLHDALGIELKIGVLFQFSTVATLAKLIEERKSADGSQFDSESNVILVRQGASGQPALFCIHGAGGNVLFMQEWKPYFGQWSLYGVESPSVDGRVWDIPTVEETAANYIKAIKEKQPHGPYLLSGFSDGGTVAYEMAQQLTARGEKVDLLLLFDTYHSSIESRTYDWPTRIKRIIRHPFNIVSGAYERKIGYPTTLAYLIKRYVARGVPVPMKHRELLMDHFFSVSASNYQPKPYAGWMVLARSQNIGYVYGHIDFDLGWGELIDSLDIIESPSDHFTIVNEPFIGELSGKIVDLWRQRG